MSDVVFGQVFIATEFILRKPLSIWDGGDFPALKDAGMLGRREAATAARCNRVYPGGRPSATRWIYELGIPLWNMLQPVDHAHSGTRTCQVAAGVA
jgi:hypothetical protein